MQTGAAMRIDPSVVLEGPTIRIEPLDPRHAEALLEAGRDEEIWRYLPYAQPTTFEEMATWIASLREMVAAGITVQFTIVDRASGRAIGMTRYMEIERADFGLEIGGTWLARPYWRSRVNTEAKYLLLRHAFETLGAIRVQLKTDLRNTRSQAAIERLGAVREGVLRNHRIVKDGYRRSSVVYSILDVEWPEVKAHLEAFMTLYPDERSGVPA